MAELEGDSTKVDRRRKRTRSNGSRQRTRSGRLKMF